MQRKMRGKAAPAMPLFAFLLFAWPPGLRAETIVSGDLATGEWTEAGSPYHATGDLAIPKGIVLTIGPGTIVSFDQGVSLAVRGTLNISGADGSPVRFLPATPGVDWDGVVFLGADASAAIEHFEMTASGPAKAGSSTYPGAFSIAGGAKVNLGHAWFHDFKNNVLDSTGKSELVILHSTIENCKEAIHSAGSYARIERVHIRNITGPNDCIDFDDESTPRSVVRNCLLEDNAEDDALDFGYTSPLVENVVVRRHRAGKALDVEGTSSPEFHGCVAYDCKWGIVSKDSCTPIFRHVTVSRCWRGVDCYEKNPGKGGGHGAADSLIVWGNEDAEVLLDGKSSFDITYSDVKGGYPGEGNLDLDPLFVDPAQDDFRIREGSPAIGKGKDRENMGALPVAYPPGATFSRGDANSDGSLDISDALAVLFYLFGAGRTPRCLDALDADDIGPINIADVAFILNFLFGEGVPPPAPYPDPGIDLTPEDPYGCEGE